MMLLPTLAIFVLTFQWSSTVVEAVSASPFPFEYTQCKKSKGETSGNVFLRGCQEKKIFLRVHGDEMYSWTTDMNGKHQTCLWRIAMTWYGRRLVYSSSVHTFDSLFSFHLAREYNITIGRHHCPSPRHA